MLAESRKKTGEERPSIESSKFSTSLDPGREAATSKISTARDSSPAQAAPESSKFSSARPAFKDCEKMQQRTALLTDASLKAVKARTLTNAEKDLRVEVQRAVGQATWKNWGGYWTNQIKEDAGRVQRLLGDLRYAIARGDNIPNPGGWMFTIMEDWEKTRCEAMNLLTLNCSRCHAPLTVRVDVDGCDSAIFQRLARLITCRACGHTLTAAALSPAHQQELPSPVCHRGCRDD